MILLALLAATAAPEAGDRAELARLLAAQIRLARRPTLAVLLAPGGWSEVAHRQILLDSARQGLRRRAVALAQQMTASEKAMRIDDLAVADLGQGETVTARDAAYRLPTSGRLLIDFGTIDKHGLRARGITLQPANDVRLIAPAAGRIAYAGPYRGYGDVLILEHGHGWTSLVAGGHLADFETGGWVSRGQGIGSANGPLLIELRHNGQPVDILRLTQRIGGSAISQQGMSR